MQKNKILFFSYWYPNKFNKIFPVFVKKHAHAVSLHNDLTVLSLSIMKGPSFYKCYSEVIYDEHQIETHQIYIQSIFYKIIYLLLPLHYLILKKYIRYRILSKKEIQVIHSNILFPCAIVGGWLAAKFNFKHVITEHWSRLDQFFSKNWYKRAGRKTYDKADAITCVSTLLQKNVQKHSANKNIIVVPNVVDSSEYYYNTNARKADLLTFVAVANWTPPKNPFYFLDALQALTDEKKLPPFKMTMIGNGSQLDVVKKKNYSFPIRYTGVLGAKNLSAELNAAHIFLHGSDFETFSTIIAEALMCGLPSVVSPVGIAQEVIKPSNGFVTNNTVADFKQKILKCYETQYDRAIIAEQLAGRYDPPAIGQLFTKVYNEINSGFVL